MKKTILFLAGSILSFCTMAQLSIGIHGTGNLANAKIKNANDFDYRSKMRAMPGAGIDLQFAFSKHLAIRTGANYIQNGVTLKATVDETVNMQLKIQNSLHYVQLPINLLYTVPLGRIQLFAGAGGYYNYGISGKLRSTLSHTMPDGNESVMEEEVDAFKKEEQGGAGLKKSDYGIGAIAGIRLGGGLFVNAGYQLSLANLDGTNDNAEYKNRSLQLTIGYFFR
jgi:hypothetical protein